MVIASHGVFAVRGFWPPNDPRGSWSDHVWAEHLQPFGDAIKVNARYSIANKPHDADLRRAIRNAMLYPPIRFDEEHIAVIAEGISDAVNTLHLKLYACAILQDHVHVVTARHAASIETILGYLKRGASRALVRTGLHPLQEFIGPRDRVPTCWVRGGWKRFLNAPPEIANCITYVRGNPARHDLPSQSWAFETPFRWIGASRRGRRG